MRELRCFAEREKGISSYVSFIIFVPRVKEGPLYVLGFYFMHNVLREAAWDSNPRCCDCRPVCYLVYFLVSPSPQGVCRLAECDNVLEDVLLYPPEQSDGGVHPGQAGEVVQVGVQVLGQQLSGQVAREQVLHQPGVSTRQAVRKGYSYLSKYCKKNF